MPLQVVRKAKSTVSFRPNAHRSENVTVLAVAPGSAPTGLDATDGAAGTLNDATYTYQVSAVSSGLEGPASAQAQATTTAGLGAGSVTLTWNAVEGADSYNVYGRTAGSIELLNTVSVLTYIDDGSDTPNGALPVDTDLVNLRVGHRANATGVDVGTAVGDYVNRYSNPGTVA